MSKHEHVLEPVDPATHGGMTALCACGDAWVKNGGTVEVVRPGTPEWEESQRALEAQRRRGL